MDTLGHFSPTNHSGKHFYPHKVRKMTIENCPKPSGQAFTISHPLRWVMLNYRKNFYKTFNKTEAVKEDFQNENILFSSSTITYQCSLESGRTKAKLVQTGIRTLWTCRLCGATDWKIIAFSILHFTTRSFLFSYFVLYFVFKVYLSCESM